MNALREISVRLGHAHYYLNAFLCLPLPVVLAFAISRTASESRDGIDVKVMIALLSGPALLLLQAMTSGTTSLEARFENITWSLRVVNLIGLVLLREHLTHGTMSCILYALCWLAISFFCPQPAYLGPKKLKLITSEEFEELVAIRPPAQSLKDVGSLVPLDHKSYAEYERKRQSDETHSVVLFHADWSRRSRQVEIVVSQLSNRYAGERIKFYIATPDSAAQTFYDLDLSTAATSLDLPTLMLFHKGQPIARLPVGTDQIVKRRKEERRRQKKLTSQSDDADNDNSSDSGAESDDERQVQAEVALERFRWKRTPESIIRAFKLDEIAKSSSSK